MKKLLICAIIALSFFIFGGIYYQYKYYKNINKILIEEMNQLHLEIEEIKEKTSVTILKHNKSYATIQYDKENDMLIYTIYLKQEKKQKNSEDI